MKTKIKSHTVLNLLSYSYTVLGDLILRTNLDISNPLTDNQIPLTQPWLILFSRNNTEIHNSTYAIKNFSLVL